ncbi:hypothetical protein MVEG_06015, partial [Podila verticillata NRRL 6337]
IFHKSPTRPFLILFRCPHTHNTPFSLFCPQHTRHITHSNSTTPENNNPPPKLHTKQLPNELTCPFTHRRHHHHRHLHDECARTSNHRPHRPLQQRHLGLPGDLPRRQHHLVLALPQGQTLYHRRPSQQPDVPLCRPRLNLGGWIRPCATARGYYAFHVYHDLVSTGSAC